MHRALRRARGIVREAVVRRMPVLDYGRLGPCGALAALWRVHVNCDVTGIEGWLTSAERRVLYALARTVPGPVAEIGAWVGLSTCILAAGIRDSGVAKPFVTHELGPRLEWFRPHGEGIGFFPPGATEPFGVCSIEAFEFGLRPVLARPGGVLGQLRANLAGRGFQDMVRVIEGDFGAAPPGPYRLVFADVLHDAAEIAANGPKLARMLAPGTILACHDSSDENEALLARHIGFRRIGRFDSLLVAEVLGPVD